MHIFEWARKAALSLIVSISGTAAFVIMWYSTVNNDLALASTRLSKLESHIDVSEKENKLFLIRHAEDMGTIKADVKSLKDDSKYIRDSLNVISGRVK